MGDEYDEHAVDKMYHPVPGNYPEYDYDYGEAANYDPNDRYV